MKAISTRRIAAALVALTGVVLVVACSSGSVPGKGATPAATGTTGANPFVGDFKVDPGKGISGSTVTANGSGFAANADFQLVWQGFQGSWKTDDTNENYKGRDYIEQLQPLATVHSDASGSFTTPFVVPDGFGFTHNVLVMKDGKTLNKTGFDVTMQVNMLTSAGPVGSPIVLEAKGIGVSSMNNSWEVSYDDKFTGWISSVSTNGYAQFSIPATGNPGVHVVRITHGSFSIPYMNMQQSPQPNRPTWMFTYTITPGGPVLPEAAEIQGPKPVAAQPFVAGSGPTAWLNIISGPVGAPMTLKASGLPANKELGLAWTTKVGLETAMIGAQGGDRPAGSLDLGKATTDASGNLQMDLKVPDDTGGNHKLVLVADGKVLTSADFRIRPSALAITPVRGAVGSPTTIELKGVDDTDTGKIYMVNYDNGLLGYSCSVSSQGDITIHMPVAGDPGWHFIDLYPGIYKGEDMANVYNFRIPQLTALKDHPGEKDLPIFHFAFYVSPS